MMIGCSVQVDQRLARLAGGLKVNALSPGLLDAGVDAFQEPEGLEGQVRPYPAGFCQNDETQDILSLDKILSLDNDKLSMLPRHAALRA